MKNSSREVCNDAKQHELHVCQLTRKGLRDALAACTDNPGFICHNCNAVANRAGNLCNPSPLARR